VRGETSSSAEVFTSSALLLGSSIGQCVFLLTLLASTNNIIPLVSSDDDLGRRGEVVNPNNG
jgi:hypothetical protein